jgi:hypothetical protein
MNAEGIADLSFTDPQHMKLLRLRFDSWVRAGMPDVEASLLPVSNAIYSMPGDLIQVSSNLWTPTHDATSPRTTLTFAVDVIGLQSLGRMVHEYDKCIFGHRRSFPRLTCQFVTRNLYRKGQVEVEAESEMYLGVRVQLHWTMEQFTTDIREEVLWMLCGICSAIGSKKTSQCSAVVAAEELSAEESVS